MAAAADDSRRHTQASTIGIIGIWKPLSPEQGSVSHLLDLHSPPGGPEVGILFGHIS